MNKKIISVGQNIKYEKTICGAIFLVGGLFFSVKGADTNLLLMVLITVVVCLNSLYSIIRHKRYEEEKFDEMATENLNLASKMVLRDQMLICVGILIVDIIFDVLKIFLGLQIKVNKYFTMSPLSCVLLVLGTQFLMTGIHFRKLERE